MKIRLPLAPKPPTELKFTLHPDDTPGSVLLCVTRDCQVPALRRGWEYRYREAYQGEYSSWIYVGRSLFVTRYGFKPDVEYEFEARFCGAKS